MSHSCPRAPLALALLFMAVTCTAAAQPAAAPAQAPRAARSAFEGYRPYGDQPVISWREANDTVGRIGGWRAYAREAASAASAPASAGADAGHGK